MPYSIVIDIGRFIPPDVRSERHSRAGSNKPLLDLHYYEGFEYER